jgi:glycosyltransferase involved in cell wall biosynthesis
MTTPSTTSPADLAQPASMRSTASPRISVALCTFNGARFLEAQLDSYLAQTRPPDELVVCDDGSTDETLTMLSRFAQRASFPVRIVRNEERLRTTKNFEKAIALCTGEFIATSDQDDVWLPDKLALSEAAIAGNAHGGLVFTNAEIVDEDLRSRGHQMWDCIQFGALARRQVRRGHAFEVLLRQWVVTGATMMFRSAFRPFVLPIPANWTHDAWIAFIIGALAEVSFVERSTLKYRQHAAQQIGGKKPTWKELYRRARETGPAYFRLAYERFQLSQERLHAHARHLREPRFLHLVDQKVEHQRRRLAIAEAGSRWSRVVWSLGEMGRGGYWRYSPGLLHFIKDMIL